MIQLVECVPNFSEGRDRGVIDRITQAITDVDGAMLLDVDPGADTNRTVVTFIGTPDAVKEAAFRAIAKAAELIDMRKQTGAHARQGATDVCPFVPVCGVTMDDCVAIAKEVGDRVGRELNIPVYLYEYAATRPERRNLAEIRSGEYEALAEKLKRPAWKPDFGPAEFNAKAGATVIGARDFLIAYNINLNTRDAKLAKKIALGLREQGKSKRDAEGKFVSDAQGNRVFEPGKFKGVKATGWYIDEYGQAQVTMNVTNHKISPFHLIYEETKKDAAELGVSVTGSELVGLLPLDAITEAGRHYLTRQNKPLGVPEKELVHIAIKSMGLEDVAPFDPKKKIIEYAYAGSGGRLVNMSGRDFVDELSTDSPAPGGGSVAALAGAQAAGLVAMVANLTHGKKEYKEAWAEMSDIGEKAQALKDDFLLAVDDDTNAFNAVMAAFRLPKSTPEEEKVRTAAVEEATKEATRVPLRVLENVPAAVGLAEIVASKGNANSLSDAGVALSMCRSAAEGAFMNVVINLGQLDDVSFKETTKRTAVETLEAVRNRVDRSLGNIFDRLTN